MWYDRSVAQHGCRVFLRNSTQFLTAFSAGAIVDGFVTMISKSFAITGRMINDGVRRLKQNLRHLLDIFHPRGVEPSEDGLKLTLRIRFVHAKIRALIDKSEEWEHDAWGVSVNAAHLALATAAFSARLTQFAQMLGAELDNKDDREAFMAVWCYDAWLMGVPETLLFHSQEEGLRLFEVGTTCEPPPDEDAIALANCIVNSAPVVIGITEPKAPRFCAARLPHRPGVGWACTGRSAELSTQEAVPNPALAADAGEDQARVRRGFSSSRKTAKPAIVYTHPRSHRSRQSEHHVQSYRTMSDPTCRAGGSRFLTLGAAFRRTVPQKKAVP